MADTDGVAAPLQRRFSADTSQELTLIGLHRAGNLQPGPVTLTPAVPDAYDVKLDYKAWKCPIRNAPITGYAMWRRLVLMRPGSSSREFMGICRSPLQSLTLLRCTCVGPALLMMFARSHIPRAAPSTATDACAC